MPEVALSTLIPLNGGDMAIAQALAGAVRTAVPDARLQLRTAQWSAAGRYYPGEPWMPGLGSLLQPKRKLPRLGGVQARLAARRILSGRRRLLSDHEQAALDELARADVVVSTGGTYLVEQYYLFPSLFEWEAAQRLGKPVLFYTQSLGPFRNRRNRRAVRRILGCSPLVLLRDERSKRNLLELGVPSANLHVAADAVFAWAPERPTFRLPAHGQELRIGVSVRQWPVGAALDSAQVRRFASAVADAVTQLVRTLAAHVTFLSTCQGIPEYWIDDSRLAALIVDALEPDVRARVEVDDAFHPPTEFQRLAAECDLFVATRMHAAILALAAGTPVVPIAYEFKTVELFRELELPELVIGIDAVTSGQLFDRVGLLLRDAEELLPRLERGVARQRASALGAESLLRDQLVRSI